MSVITDSLNIPSLDLGNATAEAQFIKSAGVPVKATLPISEQYMKLPIRILVGGRVEPGASATTFTAKLYYGTSTTIASNTEAASVTVTLTASEKQAWMIDATFFVTDSNLDDPGDVETAFTGVDGTTSTPEKTTLDLSNIAFTVTGIFGTSATANLAFVDFFQIQKAVE